MPRETDTMEETTMEETAPSAPARASCAPLWQLGLLDYGFEPSLDRLSDLACKLLGAPHGLVSIIDEEADRQYFKSSSGLTGALSVKRQTPLSQSLCKFVRDGDCFLSITNASADPRVHTHPAHVDLGINAYLGHPIHLPCGTPIGSLCVFDGEARQWTETDIDWLSELAGCADDAISRLASLRDAEDARRNAARAASARNLFLSGLNHEIRTSLNSILGLTDALSALTYDDEARALLRIIDRSGNDLSFLMETLLDEVSARTGNTCQDDRQKLHDLVVEVMDVLRCANSPEAHSFAEVDVDREDEVALVDARRFKQVVYDLLGNAMIAAPNGTTEIRVSPSASAVLTICVTLRVDAETGDTLHGSVRDLNFQLAHNLTKAVGGSFEIITPEPHRAVFKACLPLFSGDARPQH